MLLCRGELNAARERHRIPNTACDNVPAQKSSKLNSYFGDYKLLIVKQQPNGFRSGILEQRICAIKDKEQRKKTAQRVENDPLKDCTQ